MHARMHVYLSIGTSRLQCFTRMVSGGGLEDAASSSPGTMEGLRRVSFAWSSAYFTCFNTEHRQADLLLL